MEPSWFIDYQKSLLQEKKVTILLFYQKDKVSWSNTSHVVHIENKFVFQQVMLKFIQNINHS